MKRKYIISVFYSTNYKMKHLGVLKFGTQEEAEKFWVIFQQIDRPLINNLGTDYFQIELRKENKVVKGSLTYTDIDMMKIPFGGLKKGSLIKNLMVDMIRIPEAKAEKQITIRIGRNDGNSRTQS